MIVLMCLSIAIAFFKGFRLPNMWSANYFEVSILDGIFRRSLIGTFLYPLGCERFDYRVIAPIQGVIFGAALLTLLWQAIKARVEVFVALFFLSDVGGFTFNVLGYPEFLIYLWAAFVIYLLKRGFVWASSICMAASILAHEQAIFTAIPLVVLSCLLIDNEFRWRRLGKLIAPSACLFVVQWLWFQSYPDSTLTHYAAMRSECGFPIVRMDYLDALHAAYRARMSFYFSSAQQIFALPMLGVLAVTIGYSVSDRYVRRIAIWLLAAGACCAPLLQGLAGWDTNRWIMMTLINSLIVLIIARRTGKLPMAVPTLRAPAVTAFALIACTLSVDYFELQPRPLNDAGLKAFETYMQVGLHRIPKR